MKISCIIIEDEPLALERAKLYIQKTPALSLLAEFDNGNDGLLFLNSNHVDLVFLDINLGTSSGIELLETTTISSQVILTTAYSEFALKGFDLKVADYLLKPYTYERFLQAVERVQDNLVKAELAADRKFIFIKTEYRLEKLFFDDVLFIEGMRDYRKIHTTTNKIMTLKTFTELEQEIPPEIICRVHKSYMVALDKIESIEKDRVKIKDVFIPISETYKKAFLTFINPSANENPI